MRFWNFAVVNQGEAEEQVELRIGGDIVSDDDVWFYEWFGMAASSPNAFRSALAEHKGKPITVWIDSYGGDVFAAAGIYNALKEHRGDVTVKIDGKAMSAASVIAMAGDKILISPLGQMMIHNPSGYAGWGEAKDMRHVADVLDSVKQSLVNAYQIRTGKSRKKIAQMMDSETFMDAKMAVEEDFADGMLYTEADAGVQISNAFKARRMSIQNAASDSLRAFIEKTRAIPEPVVAPPLDTYRAKLNNLRRRRNGL